tara:strand:- start:924 stop:1313 length:390 start_codon:yes stop_codon:yes gene_type:complete
MNFETLVRAEPLETQEQWEELLEQFQKGRGIRSNPVFPTHLLRRKGEVVGSFCVGSPTVHLQMDKEKCNWRDSLIVWSVLESLMLENNINQYVIACEPTSPFYNLLQKRLLKITGEENCENWHLFKRNL